MIQNTKKEDKRSGYELGPHNITTKGMKNDMKNKAFTHENRMLAN